MQANETPLANGPNGRRYRDATGRFLPGNAGGPGNPHAAAVGAWRSALAQCVTDQDIREVVAKLLDLAKKGNLKAIEIVLDRTLGKPMPAEEYVGEPDDAAPEPKVATWGEIMRGLGLTTIPLPPGIPQPRLADGE
jgi:hypothetical protein